MKHQIALPKAYVRDTGTGKGRGVFSAARIGVGEIVEVSPVVVLRERWDSMPEEVRRVVFNWAYLTDQAEATSCLTLGWASMYNHANPANLRYQAVPSEACMLFIAATDIERDEELTINYNETCGDITSTEDVWFEGTGIVPIR